MPLSYPRGLEDMQGMFRTCATARLFVHEMLPDSVDAGIFLDTDIILHDDLANLWKNFL